MLKFSPLVVRLHLVSGLLIALLQRMPVAVFVRATKEGASGWVTHVLRSAIVGVGGLGVMHAQTGATQVLPTVSADPTTPLRKKVGDAFEVKFKVQKSAEQADPEAWRIRGTLPPGMRFGTLESPGIVRQSTISLSGKLTRAGEYEMVIDAARFGTFSEEQENLGHITPPFTYKIFVEEGPALPPQIVSQPVGQSVASGGSVTFAATATGNPSPTFQWRHNGGTIAGATANTFTLPSVQLADAGSYVVVVENSAGSVVSNVANLVVTPPAASSARLSNLSVRTAMAAGQTLIVGVVVNDGSRDILVRAAGPALGAFGLSAAMLDPQLELYRGSDRVLANNDWAAALAPMFASVGAFSFTTGSKDAAFVQGLNAAYSIQARGTGPGVVLVEAYDTGPTTPARLVNVSARNRVGTGDELLIAGFTISGSGEKALLIRAVGPKLAVFGVTGFLANPKLEIYNAANVKVSENDDWTPGLAGRFSTVGAFELDAGSRDAALVATLPPGSYTAQVRGSDGGTGEALIEIYELP